MKYCLVYVIKVPVHANVKGSKKADDVITKNIKV